MDIPRQKWRISLSVSITRYREKTVSTSSSFRAMMCRLYMVISKGTPFSAHTLQKSRSWAPSTCNTMSEMTFFSMIHCVLQVFS